MGVHNTTWTDEDILDVLDMHERHGMSAAEIAKRKGGSRSAICGLIYRANFDTDKAEIGSKVAKPENLDGGMPPCWWKNRRWAA